MARDAILVDGPVRRHVFNQTLPMLFGIGATMSVGVLDAYFIGQLGPDPLTAISFIFPVQVALQSLGVGILVGINSTVSRALGARRQSEAASFAVRGTVVALLLGLVIALALLAYRHPLFRLLNASREIRDVIDLYMIPYALGFPLVLVAMGLNGVLRGQGEALRSSSILIAVAIVNWVLDPLLIAGWGPFPGYGISGAAYATVTAFFAAAALGLYHVQMGRVPLRLARLLGAGWQRGLADLARVGGPAAFSNAINPMGLTLLTGVLATYGAEQVAGFGVAGRVQSLAVVPLLALSSSIGPIVGQNWGAGRKDRAAEAWRFSLLLSLLYGTVAAALLVALRAPLATLFTDDAAVARGLSTYLVIAAWGYGGFGVLIVTNGALNAVNRAFLALGASVTRVFAVMLPLAWLAPLVFDAEGVYIAVLGANLLGGALAYAVGRLALTPYPERLSASAPVNPGI